MRKETTDDHHDRLERVKRYIEDHLGEELTVAKLAEVANFSPYHFHRIFRAHYGVSVAHYIRQRRMRAARRELIQKEAVIEVAFNCGYESHAAFSKAFRKTMGMAPKQYKELEMKPDQMVRRKGTNVLYARTYGDYFTMPQHAWSRLMAYAQRHELLSSETEYYGMALDNPEEVPTDRLRYDACITIPGDAPEEEGIERQIIDGGLFAEFTHKGEYEGLGETYNRIFNEWFPSSGLKLAHRPSFCQYLNPEAMNEPEKLITKVYIPIEE